MVPLNFLRNICFHGYKFARINTISCPRLQNPCYSIRTEMVRPSFNVEKYDCIGFDLDNTLCEYKLDALVPMEYSAMAEYLITKGYSEEIVTAPLGAKELDFMQRGLLLDFERGNILKLNSLGEIYKASHGTRFLSHEEVINIYGETKKCQITIDFSKDMTLAWEPSMLCSFRVLLDFFDMPASLIFARGIDDMDRRGIKNYNKCGEDILETLQECYSREHFHTGKGGFYKHMKRQPELYINKCSDMIINWLQELNKSKIVFLVTGSNVDLCHFTASHCLGESWRNLFDVVICYAKKPGFFKYDRPFYATRDLRETLEIDGPEMGKVLSQGNWRDLYSLLAKTLDKPKPSCLYFGDNLVEDIYTPSKWGCCETAAVVDEIFNVSECWGSFATPETFWGSVLQKYSLTYVPSLKNLAAYPFKEGVPFIIEQDTEHESIKK